MRPVRTDKTNLTLVHEHAGDLPTQVLITGSAERPMGSILSTWQPDPDERAKLAAGGHIELIHEICELDPAGDDLQEQMQRLAKSGMLTHPPVAFDVTDPPVTAAVPTVPTGPTVPTVPAVTPGPPDPVDRGHLNRALGLLFGCLNANPPIGYSPNTAGPDAGPDVHIQGDPNTVDHGPVAYVVQRYMPEDGHYLGEGGSIVQFEDWINLVEHALNLTQDVAPAAATGDLALPTDVKNDLK